MMGYILKKKELNFNFLFSRADSINIFFGT